MQDLYNTFTGKNGSLEFSDFSSLNDTFKDMEGISTYLEKLQEAGDNTVKFKEIINEMYDAMLNAPDLSLIHIFARDTASGSSSAYIRNASSPTGTNAAG